MPGVERGGGATIIPELDDECCVDSAGKEAGADIDIVVWNGGTSP